MTFLEGSDGHVIPMHRLPLIYIYIYLGILKTRAELSTIFNVIATHNNIVKNVVVGTNLEIVIGGVIFSTVLKTILTYVLFNLTCSTNKNKNALKKLYVHFVITRFIVTTLLPYTFRIIVKYVKSTLI